MMRPAEVLVGAERAPAATVSTPRLAALLALTALPVALTTALLSIPGVADAVYRYVAPPYHSFAVYAVANWVTFAIVVAVAGWRRLRAHGLRFPVTGSRIAAALGAFAAGLAVFQVVSRLLAMAGLPPVGGMDFANASTADVAILFFSAVITAPFCEEVFFRVLWIGGLRSRVPVAVAGAVSIFAFAAIHFPYFGVGGVLFIIAWSILPVALFIHFRDVTASLTMHVLNNVFAYILVPFLLSPTP